MEHYISSENCEKEIKEILCVPEKENVLVYLGLNIEEINGMLMNFKVIVEEEERKNSVSRMLDSKRICR
jgi:hypothetical protein